MMTDNNQRNLSITVICINCTGEIPEVMSVIAETDTRRKVEANELVEYSLKARCVKCGHEVMVDILEDMDEDDEEED